MAALLRAVVHQSVLAYVEVAGAGTAAPIVFLTSGNIVLETIHARKRSLSEYHDFFEYLLFPCAQRPQLPAAIMNDAGR